MLCLEMSLQVLYFVVFTIASDCLSVSPAAVWWQPMNLHSDKGVKSFPSPGEGEIGSTNHLWGEMQGEGAILLWVNNKKYTSV